MPRRLLVVISHLGLLFVFVSLALSAVAQPLQSRTRFDTLLSSLSQRHRICIISEGQPLRLELPQKESIALEAALSNPDQTLEVKVAQLATAFDYESRALNPSLYILLKKYTNPEDLPAITFEEARKSLENIFLSLPRFKPVVRGDALSQLYRSLTASQRSAIQTEVTVASLLPEQREVFERFAYSFAFHGLEELEYLKDRLNGCRHPKACFKRQTFFELNLPYYEYYSEIAKGMMAQVVLSLWVFTEVRGGTTFEGRGEATEQDGKILSAKPEPTTPRTEKVRLTIDTLKVTRTLGEITHSATERLKKQNTKYKHVTVEPYLASKPCFITGEERVTPPDLINAVAEVYGLRVSHPKEDTILITVQRPKVTHDPTMVRTEVSRLLPLPYVRAISAGRAQERFVETIREVREIVEPKLDIAGESGFRMTEADPRALDMIALASLLTCVKAITSIPESLPSYIQKMDQARFSMTIKPVPNSQKVEVNYRIACKAIGDRETTGIGGRLVTRASRFQDSAPVAP